MTTVDSPNKISCVSRITFKTSLFVVAIFALLTSGRAIAQGGHATNSGPSHEKLREAVLRIIDRAEHDSTGYRRLEYLCDTFGPRLSGSGNLVDAIEWTRKEMQRDKFPRVFTEEVMVPHWVRGVERADLVFPRTAALTMLGLGGSVATPEAGIEAEILAVSSFQELTRRSAEALGKIVLFDVPYTNYGETVQYRSRGAIDAARAGAVASLIRSVTPVSLLTPHTGAMHYADSVPKIPHAAVAPEDAMMLHRMVDRGQKPRVRLIMGAQTLPDTISHNVIAEIPGTEFPDEIVVFGGHFDSWDAGHGAHDDAAGCIAAWEALRILQQLELKPKRTLRLVFWTNEENGVRGGRAYAERHANERHVFALEADAGIFSPRGFGFTGTDSAITILRKLAPLLAPLGADTITQGGGGVDISFLTRSGVPSAGLSVDGSKYFWYHHSTADTVDKVDPKDFWRCSAAIAALVYAVAELPRPLPR
ncbi:MAG: M20/M25/M40 family metallo-hydrolase [Ignavibacteriae bacterium]|nr:M20/M25/M40 family metallo-hydrolase [Ignavibacteriota bacterium]